jgi:hypothetical protein
VTDKLMTTVQEALTQVGPRLTRSLLEKVAGPVDREKGRLLTQFIYGSITWSVELGRPDGATLASGFKITHESYYFEAVATAGGVDIRKGFAEIGDVSSWDAEPADGKHHVAFFAQWHSLPPNRFSVDLVPMPWRDENLRLGGVRSLRPRSALVAEPTQIQFLEFEVVQIPYLDIERAGILTEG